MSPVAARLAELIVRARRAHSQFGLAETGGELATADEAYAVQDEVARTLRWFRGGRPSAWKCGAPSLGATPIAAPLPDEGVVRSPARFAAGTFHAIGIEAEIAFRFGAAPDLSQADASFDWARTVAALAVTIEVVDTRIADVGNASPWVKLADLQQHGALVIGDEVPYRSVDWRGLRAIVRRNGKPFADTTGGHPLGDPHALLPWFARHVAARTGGLRTGDLVTAGTWVGLLSASPGDTIEATFEGIGSASVRFD